ncbi:hypothetical protein EDB85DRAFT_1896231 [Lactarius pseudohatsudake]|nr:hypothetical protein EDB85DRAFT_1896231 [Lactarius pseudohatsudake]
MASLVSASVRHGFVNPYGYPGMGLTGTGTGTTLGTRSEPAPVWRVWRSSESPSRLGRQVALSSSTRLGGVALVVFVVFVRVVVVVVGVDIVFLLSTAGPWQRRRWWWWWWWWRLVAVRQASGNESTANPACAAYANHDNPQRRQQSLCQPRAEPPAPYQRKFQMQRLRHPNNNACGRTRSDGEAALGCNSERLDDDDRSDNGDNAATTATTVATTATTAATTASRRRRSNNGSNNGDDGSDLQVDGDNGDNCGSNGDGDDDDDDTTDGGGGATTAEGDDDAAGLIVILIQQYFV